MVQGGAPVIGWETGTPKRAGIYLAQVRDDLTGRKYPEILRAKPVANWPGEILWERERDRAPLYDDETVVCWVEMEEATGP